VVQISGNVNARCTFTIRSSSFCTNYMLILSMPEKTRSVLSNYFILSRVGEVRVKKIASSSSDVWIYWHFI
jgi:hypothetical protein